MFEITNKSAVISSVDLVKMINGFRKEECDLKAKQQADNGEVITAKYTELDHSNFLKSIDSEVETMNLLGLDGAVNFYGSSYTDKQSKQRRCFYMTRDGALQMLNKESTYVRVKTVQYVDTLENKLSSLEQQKAELLLQIYNGGQQGILASQQLTEIEIQEATAPLLGTIAEQDTKINELQDDVDHQYDTIITLTQDVDLMSKRQRINQIVHYKANGNYRERWSMLYSHFEKKFHCDLKKRMQRDINQGTCKKSISKMDYICDIMKLTQELYDLTIVIFQADYIELLQAEMELIN